MRSKPNFRPRASSSAAPLRRRPPSHPGCGCGPAAYYPGSGFASAGKCSATALMGFCNPLTINICNFETVEDGSWFLELAERAPAFRGAQPWSALFQWPHPACGKYRQELTRPFCSAGLGTRCTIALRLRMSTTSSRPGSLSQTLRLGHFSQSPIALVLRPFFSHPSSPSPPP